MTKSSWTDDEINEAALWVGGNRQWAQSILDAAGAVPRREYEALRDAAATFAITVAKQDMPAGEAQTLELLVRCLEHAREILPEEDEDG